ncbi:MAG: Ppx/GppA family phosphatase [Rhodospirillales bacterium]|nr:Ppx/GppA family phosphatase [Rhodospirillales bacterium]
MAGADSDPHTRDPEGPARVLDACGEGKPYGRGDDDRPVPGRVGVVDIGSNTVRLVVYDVPTRLPIPIFNEKAQCALGAGLGQTGRLNPKGIDEARRSLLRFVRLARAMGIERLELVATAAVRDAVDGPAFVARIEETCGFPVHVLSGAEEARLAAVGLLNGTPNADGMLGDLGGGSLDLVSLEKGEVGRFATLPGGHLRVGEESGGDRAKARAILDERLADVPWLKDIGGRTIFCVGGSWRALARVFIDQTHHPLHVVDNYTIGFFQARKLAELIASLSLNTLERLPGVAAARQQTLPFAAAALSALLHAAKPKEVVFSAYGMREGQMLELLPTAMRRQDPLISACEMAAERTSRFSISGAEMLDWLSPLFLQETPGERRLRLATCLLSDIGWSEHPDYRALHAYHRVLRIPYPGLSHSDRAETALATLIRYGGNEDDHMAAPVRTLLDERRLARARMTGLGLRLAHTLSGGAPGLLSQTRLRLTERTLTLDVPSDGAAFLSEAVERRFTRLARAIGVKPTFVA